MARKILLADDSVTAQNMGRKILVDAGYEVIAVNNGSAALKKIAELKPELVILDVYMPGYSGLEVCQRLKESQETARIPVLLTVGKLEPFKPEEAKRVRAEGYIIKPFEASELLSALAKLEDKIVPRPEPSKPGRFARAMAATEEAPRDVRGDPSNRENGWKSRIAFPHQKTESELKEEKLAEEASTHKPNRDLRAAVESFEQKSHTRRKEDRQDAPNVDVAALSPAGLPKDVTPEELAAITAAAAQIQMAGAAANHKHPPTSTGNFPQEKSSEETSEVSVERFADNSPALETPTDNNPVSHIVSADAAAPAVTEIEHRNPDENVNAGAENTPDEPVTMAAASESLIASTRSTPRWTAVSVPLDSDEAALSLDGEMQKANAAFASVDSGADSSLSQATVVAAENSPEPVAAQVETPHAEFSNPENDPLSTMRAAEPDPPPLGHAQAFQEPTASVAPTTADLEPANNPQVMSATAESTEAIQDHAPSAVENHITQPDASAPTSWGPPEAEAATVEFPAASTLPELYEEVHEELQEEVHAQAQEAAYEVAREQEPEPEPQRDSETVKTTAAAWASWRQIRDTSTAGDQVPSQPAQFETPVSVPDETHARAVAAGAEQLVQEAVANEENRSPADVASIVDSVLADLRPKLMEEISRKMAQKK